LRLQRLRAATFLIMASGALAAVPTRLSHRRGKPDSACNRFLCLLFSWFLPLPEGMSQSERDRKVDRMKKFMYESLLRRLYYEAIEVVQAGGDPRGVVRSAPESIVRFDNVT
jgi:hypothetical protein